MYYFLILIVATTEIVYTIPFIRFYPFYIQFFKQTHLIIIMPYLYLYYKTTIKVSQIITSTSKKYENIDTNICLQLGLISSSKLDSPGFCGISLGIEKSNPYQYYKILYGLVKILWEGVAVKIWCLGLVIVCFSLVTWCTLCKCLVTSIWVSLVQKWYYPWYICVIFHVGWLILMNFWRIELYFIHIL